MIKSSKKVTFGAVGDYVRLLPRPLEQPFTNKSLAPRLHRHRRIAQMLTSTLCKIGALEAVARSREGIHYRVAEAYRPLTRRSGARCINTRDSSAAT